jgi:hypothetical protein
MKSFDEMLEEGYEYILVLPSYVVIQHPTSFHTLIFYNNHTKNLRRGDNLNRMLIGQYQTPGLSSDPSITLPAGMWREWLKETEKIVPSTPRRTVDWNQYIAQHAQQTAERLRRGPARNTTSWIAGRTGSALDGQGSAQNVVAQQATLGDMGAALGDGFVHYRDVAVRREPEDDIDRILDEMNNLPEPGVD